jgi:2-phosphosulfolactate phosphatase
MTPSLHVHFLPALVPPDELAGSVVVVIDVLRASTTITHALVAGAKEVIPCREVDDAIDLAQRLSRGGPVVCGGERGGLQIPGFELSNSPTCCTRDSVGGKTLVFTTTNGTLAMECCRDAARVFIGAFVNRTAVKQKLREAYGRGLPLKLLCAGTGGRITREDVLFAGALVDLLVRGQDDAWDLNDQAIVAGDAWNRIKIAEPERGETFEFRPVPLAGQRVVNDRFPVLSETVARELMRTQGGRNLEKIGLAGDIVDAGQVDLVDLVPELFLSDWAIRPANELEE